MEKENQSLNKKNLISDLANLPFSHLIILFVKASIVSGNKSLFQNTQNILLYVLDQKQKKIYINDKEILLNFDFFIENNLINYDIDALELSSGLNRKLIFLDNTSVQELFNYFFSFVFSGCYDDPMFSELVISKNFDKFIKLELVNVNNRIKNIIENDNDDINNINTLSTVKNIYVDMLNYQFNDIYGYLSNINPYYFRNLKRINSFINREMDISKDLINRYESMIASGYMTINYENDVIYDCIYDSICNQKIIYFPKIKKKV